MGFREVGPKPLIDPFKEPSRDPFLDPQGLSLRGFGSFGFRVGGAELGFRAGGVECRFWGLGLLGLRFGV